MINVVGLLLRKRELYTIANDYHLSPTPFSSFSYSYSEAGALQKAQLEELIEKAQGLDMADVHKQMKEDSSKE